MSASWRAYTTVKQWVNDPIYKTPTRYAMASWLWLMFSYYFDNILANIMHNIMLFSSLHAEPTKLGDKLAIIKIVLYLMITSLQPRIIS